MFEREIYGQRELSNGLRIVWERMPWLRSVTVGVWVGTGSRNESSAVLLRSGTSLHTDNYRAPNGISHFTEHMLFKGTDSRSAKELAECIENIGGQINAFTGKELTCYFTKTLDTSLETAVEVLSDMVLHSRFDTKDIDMERKVVLEEISMDEDTPDDLVHEALAQGVYSDSTLGLPILGTAECLEAIDTNAFREYTGRYYTPDNTCISVVGNFEEEDLLAVVQKYFGSWERGTGSHTDYKGARFHPGLYLRHKDIEQLHMCIAFPSPTPEEEQDSVAMAAISTYLGGGMSSQLFQELREKRGLVYNTYTYVSSYKNNGMTAVYGAMNPDKAREFISVVRRQLEDTARQGIDSRQLDNLRQQMKGTLVLSAESSSSRMNNLGKNLILYNEIKPLDQLIDMVDKLDTDRVNSVLRRYLSCPELAVSAVGSITEKQLTEYMK